MADYYVDFTLGLDANDGSIGSPWKTLSKADDLTGNRSDISVLLKRGETWREAWNVACYGTSGHPFTIGAYGTGDKPKIYCSDARTSWAKQATYKWRAACATAPDTVSGVWFVLVDGSVKWGKKQTASANLAAEYDYYYDGSTYLWVYTADDQDPGTKYSSVESRGARTYGIMVDDKDYVTIQDLEVRFAPNQATGGACIFSRDSTYVVVDGCTCCYTADKGTGAYGEGISMTRNSYCTISNNIIHDIGCHGIYYFGNNTGGATYGHSLITGNVLYDCYYAFIDSNSVSGSGTLTDVEICKNMCYCSSNFDLTWQDTVMGIHCQTESATDYMTAYKIHHNILFNISISGIQLAAYCNGFEVYNNTVGPTDPNQTIGANGSKGISLAATVTNAKIKNNIAFDCTTACLYVTSAGSIASAADLDYNCWYRSAGGTAPYAYVAGTNYHYNDFAAYKSATGWDTHSKWEDPILVSTS